VCPASAAFRAFGFAAFTAFWFVLKSFVGEEHLFAGGKNELRIAIGTLQYPVVVFHEPLSPGPVRCRESPARSVLVRPTNWRIRECRIFPKAYKLKQKQVPAIP
jgi:hypothetical protein